MDALPDGSALWTLRGWAARLLLDLAESRHVFDGYFDLEFEEFSRARVDDGHGPEANTRGVLLSSIRSQVGDLFSRSNRLCERFRRRGFRAVRAGEEPRDFFEWTLGRGESDALQAGTAALPYQCFESFQRDRQM